MKIHLIKKDFDPYYNLWTTSNEVAKIHVLGACLAD